MADIEHFFEEIMEHDHALAFVGGIAAAYVAKKVISSESTKNACTNVVSKVITAKKEAEEQLQNIKDNAEDISVDAEVKDKKAVYDYE